MKVEVYRNLHKKCWSVRWPNGRVLAHTEAIHLIDVTLVVRPAGRTKVLLEKRKNVHAFAKGELIACPEALPGVFLQYSAHHCESSYPTQIIYNPYEYDSFVIANSKEPIFKADNIYLNNKGEVYVS